MDIVEIAKKALKNYIRVSMRIFIITWITTIILWLLLFTIILVIGAKFTGF